MNTTTKPPEWTHIKGKISAKWSKFTDGDIEKFKDKMEAISEQIQKTYGHTKEKADQEYKDFQKELSAPVVATVTGPVVASKT